MPTTTIRINPSSHQTLAMIARERHVTLQQALNDAIEAHRRRFLLERANDAYARLRKNPKAWASWKKEMKTLDHTLDDGL